MKVASRFLLPLEIFTALLMLSWGLAAWYGGGIFVKSLAQAELTDEWGLCLCGVGLMQLCAAVVEGTLGRRWPPQVLLRSVQLRFWAAFAGIATWLYTGYLLLTLPRALESCVLAMQIPMGLVACVAIVLQNRKVEVLLDPDVSTQDLQKRMREERSHNDGNSH